jgi:hypothetical protein
MHYDNRSGPRPSATTAEPPLHCPTGSVKVRKYSCKAHNRIWNARDVFTVFSPGPQSTQPLSKSSSSHRTSSAATTRSCFASWRDLERPRWRIDLVVESSLVPFHVLVQDSDIVVVRRWRACASGLEEVQAV